MTNPETPRFDIFPFIVPGIVMFVLAMVAVRFLLHFSWPLSVLAGVAFLGVFAVVVYLTRPRPKSAKHKK